MPVDDLRFIFIVGHSGSGKTTLIKSFIPDCDWRAREHPSEGSRARGAWIVNETESIIIFGRWTGFHEIKNTAFDSRLDGTDRIHWSAVHHCKDRIQDMRQNGAKLLIADGTTLLAKPLVDTAQAAGYKVELWELQIQHGRATRRRNNRENGAPGTQIACKAHNAKWASRRKKWTEYTHVMGPVMALKRLRKLARSATGNALKQGPTARGKMSEMRSCTSSTGDGTNKKLAAAVFKQKEEERARDAKRKRDAYNAMSDKEWEKKLAERREKRSKAAKNKSLEASLLDQAVWRYRQNKCSRKKAEAAN